MHRCFWLAIATIIFFSQSMSVFANPLNHDEIKALNEYPNWVADVCSTGDPGNTLSTSGETTGPAKAVQQVVWSTLVGGGIDSMHAAAVMGNIAHEGVWDPESVENLPGLPPRSTDPAAAGKYGYGLIGWTPGSSLLDQMKEASINGKPYTAETQAAVILAEIQGKTPSYYPASLGKQFLDTKNIKEATTAYQGNSSVGGSYLGFERPADESGSLPDRIASAKHFLQEFGGTTATPVSGSETTGSNCSCPSNGVVTDSSLSGNTPAQQAFNFYVSKGLAAQAAAGIVGNFMAESGGDTEQLQPAITNSIGAHGIAQWLGGRLSYLEDYAANNNVPEDKLATQLGFSWTELTGDYSNVLSQLKNVSSVDDAATIFNSDYEVSGVDPSSRITNAKKLLSEYGGTSAPGATTSSNNCASSSTTSGTCNVTKPLYTDVLSVQQLSNIYGDPGTASSHPQMDSNLTTVSFLGNSVQVNKLVAPCLEAVAQQISSEHINYKITEMGCYRFDSNNGSSNIGLMSYHTYGAACDINWDSNPFVASGAPTAHTMPDAYIKAFNSHGFYWGGDWTSPKDYMHFEFHGVKPPS
jgi:hypothetical protein